MHDLPVMEFGFGAETDDTLVPKTEFTAGETVEERRNCPGGGYGQDIDQLYFGILTRVDNDVVVDQFKVAEPVSLSADECWRLTTEVSVSPWSTIGGESPVWLKTALTPREPSI